MLEVRHGGQGAEVEPGFIHWLRGLLDEAVNSSRVRLLSPDRVGGMVHTLDLPQA